MNEWMNKHSDKKCEKKNEEEKTCSFQYMQCIFLPHYKLCMWVDMGSCTKCLKCSKFQMNFIFLRLLLNTFQSIDKNWSHQLVVCSMLSTVKTVLCLSHIKNVSTLKLLHTNSGSLSLSRCLFLYLSLKLDTYAISFDFRTFLLN